MAENSQIGWTTHTFNPVVGCTKVSAACDHCYAAEYAKRYEPLVKWGEPGQKAVLRRTSPSNWHKPIVWEKKANKLSAIAGQHRQRVFCASLSDVFDNDWDPQVRADLFDLIGATPSLDWLLLTKRPQNIAKMLPADWGNSGWSNVWLGTTVENQAEADRRIPHLLKVPARIHFLSCEPLLGAIDLTPYLLNIDWVIIGGESGHGFRPLNTAYVDSLVDQSKRAGVKIFFKQDSSIKPGIRGRASDALWAMKETP